MRSPTTARVVPLRRAEPLSDRELVERTRGGDRWAEDQLCRRHFGKVLATVSRLLGDPHEAEDIAQDALLAALGELRDLRDADAFGGWLLRIAVHKVHRRFRRRRMLRALGFAPHDPERGLAELASDEASPEQRAELVLLERTLASIDSADRVAWMLRYVEGMKLEEVAGACEASLATIKRRIVRADRHVRAHVALDTSPLAPEAGDET